MDDDFRGRREEMVGTIEENYGLNSPEVSGILKEVPRHLFAPKKFQDLSYEDNPVDIGFGQTMSQPYTVAMMTHLVLPVASKGKDRKSKVLEVGTGSGYQAAVLSYLFDEIYSLEIVPELAGRAQKLLKKLKYKNVYVKNASGMFGWEEKSPYDAIMVTAGIEEVPNELFRELKVGGVLVAPVGKSYDKVMTRYTKESDLRSKLKTETFGTFHFVPFIEARN